MPCFSLFRIFDQNEGILTGKLFEYLGSGRNIIGIGPSHGDAAAIIRECRCGDMFDYSDEAGLEKYIRLILQEENTQRDCSRQGKELKNILAEARLLQLLN